MIATIEAIANLLMGGITVRFLIVARGRLVEATLYKEELKQTYETFLLDLDGNSTRPILVRPQFNLDQMSTPEFEREMIEKGYVPAKRRTLKR